MGPSLWNDQRFIQLARVAAVVLMVYLGVLAIGELKSLRYIGTGITATDTISVSGEGEVYAVPDTAEFTVSVQQTAKDVSSAQAATTKDANAIIAYLKGAGVDEKDIQTTDYSIQPQYDYQQGVCPQVAPAAESAAPLYCPPGRQVLTGYQVAETLDVKVRDTSKAGDLLAGVGGKGATNVSGLNFTVADQTALEAEARDKAIADAKTKADALAKSLGVSIVRVVNFSENQQNPIPFAKAAYGMGGGASVAPAPQIQTGQNKIVSDVSITYEIE